MEHSEKDNADGLWEACASMEAVALHNVTDTQRELELAFELAYEGGVEAPTLPAGKNAEPDLRVAALFLKRTLTDLRSCWILISSGYVTQAASVTASLWENALAVGVIAGNPERATAFLASQDGDLPWSPTELAKLYAQSQTSIPAAASPSHEHELLWREHYGAYKWLCKLKHPTLPSAVHDAGTSTRRDQEFVVMAVPDIRPDNVGMMLAVATIALSRTLSAASSFVHAAKPEESQRYYSWAARWKRAAAIVVKAMQSEHRPALTLDPESKLSMEYAELKKQRAPLPGDSV